MQPSRVQEARPRGPTSLSPRQSTVMHPSLLLTPPATPSQPAIQIETHGIAIQCSSPRAKMSSHPHYHTSSRASIDTDSSHRSRKEYMDSLVPPSSAEMARITEVQLEREKQEKRKSREKDRDMRRSMDLTRSSLESHSQDKPRRGSIFGSLRHHNKSTPANTHSRQSSIAIPAPASQAPDSDNILMQHAATLIQKTYRGYKTRREMKGLGLDADTRWTHAIRELRFREMVQPRGKDVVPVPLGTMATQKGLGGDSDEAKRKSFSARYKWRKVATIAARAAADMDDEPTSSSDSEPLADPGISTSEQRRIAHQKREEAKARRQKDARVMGLQYFLEMVDLKHRYGSNLRTYHEEWKKADTNEPFFYWLDFGQGRNLDMATCPRERLDREQVRYLSREERLYYLVQVDAQGRLCWAKNGMRIDTTEEWKDSIHGIVPVDDPTPAFHPKSTNSSQAKPVPSDASSSHASSSRSSSRSGSGGNISHASSSELEAARAAKYASPGFTDAKGYKKVTHISASTIFNTLLRKSVRKNTWIFVADTSFRLYVGIKDSGAFQHSSFVQGSRISAAGLIKIKNGRLTSLSPLSGHYRPPASNFRAFVHSLKEEGVDMSHVSISKSYAVLVGLEIYMKTQQKGKGLLKKAAHRKDKIVHPEIAQRREEDARDTSQSAEKERQYLERQRAEQVAAEESRRDERRSTVRVMQKLRISPMVSETPEGERVTSEQKTEKEVEQVEAQERAEAEGRAEAAGKAAACAADAVDR